MSATLDDKTVAKIFELGKEIKDLSCKVDELSNLLAYQPDTFTISILEQETKKSRHTLRSHLLNNYEPEKDFYIKSGKIMMNGKTFVAIRKYYDNKSK